MMYMCTCAFKHLFLHEPVLNSTQLNLRRSRQIREREVLFFFFMFLLGDLGVGMTPGFLTIPKFRDLGEN